MLKVYSLAIIFVFLFLGIFIQKPQTLFAADLCRGVVITEDNTPLPDVKIDLYVGDSFSPRIQSTQTKPDGSYEFRVVGFGIGGLSTHKVVFQKEGYLEKIIDYSRGGNCPGNITLTSFESEAPGYICDQGQCKITEGDSKFSDEASCKADCGIFRYNSTKGFCEPDPNGNFYSLRECQAQTPVTSEQKYKYFPQTNTCKQDPAGTETWEECSKKTVVGAGCNDKNAVNSNCTSAGGEVCNIVNGKQAKSREDIDPVSGKKTIEYVDAETGEVIPHEKRGVFTALGCIPTQPQPLIEGILKFAFGIGGGIALLLMAYGAFQMITSGGNQDNVKKGSEQFTQAIIGLLFIIFSVLLLQIIGADILNIPGFGK